MIHKAEVVIVIWQRYKLQERIVTGRHKVSRLPE